MATAEQRARNNIDQLLIAAGWRVQNYKEADIHAGRRVALWEFPLADEHGCADYPFRCDSEVAGVIETKREGVALTRLKPQPSQYSQGLPVGNQSGPSKPISPSETGFV